MMKKLLIISAAIGLSLSAYAQEYQKRTVTDESPGVTGSFNQENNNTLILDFPYTDNGYTKTRNERKINVEFSNTAAESYTEGVVPADQNFNNVCLIPAIQDYELSVNQNYCPQHVEGPRRYSSE
jgi:hypothetical protein